MNLRNRRSTGLLPVVVVLALVVSCDDSSDGSSGAPTGGTPTAAGANKGQGNSGNGTGGGSTGAGCLEVTVELTPKKPNGSAWDADLFSTAAPDPFIKAGGANFRGQRCEDSYTCSFTVCAASPLSIEVYDADVSNDDFAGYTTCSLGKCCNTGQGATVCVD